ncbi:hypothetical protein CCB80_10590 [Armatimonadetes bacterium Uphvl-Ar1]|nr:hypothetical protein CCB80_10590 [Armatimonadetes bacterium Uphvl-Ar1]
MGALRKTSPAVVQPTQIIVFPIDQARPDLVEKPSFWERMEESEVGNLVLFELKMFGMTAIIAALIGGAILGSWQVKQAANFDMNENVSSSAFVGGLAESAWQPTHYLN